MEIAALTPLSSYGAPGAVKQTWIRSLSTARISTASWPDPEGSRRLATLDGSVYVVLGSDGYGIYGASAESAARAALIVGLTPEDLAGPLAAVEADIIARAEERDAASLPARRSFVVPADLAPVAYTPAVVERRRALDAERERALAARLAELAVPSVTRAEVVELSAGRLLVCVAGAWKPIDGVRRRTSPEEPSAPIAGGDDADDARWFALSSLPARLAFDHAKIIDAARAELRAPRDPRR